VSGRDSRILEATLKADGPPPTTASFSGVIMKVSMMARGQKNA
jgi:hypothetical protein